MDTLKKIECFILTVKYFIQGDSWQGAKQYARVIVFGFTNK